MLLNNNNLHQFLTNRRANSQKPTQNNSKINTNVKSKSNANMENIEKQKNKFNIFTNINSKSKEKKNSTKFKEEKNPNYFNNINLKTEHNFNRKNPSKPPKELKFNISLLNMSKNKRNSFKTLNYDRSPFVRIMKYFTIKSNNKPMDLDELSPVLIPIRNTLSNEHRKNNEINMNNENIKDKINFFYYINSKQKASQLIKEEKINKYNSTNNSHGNGVEQEGQKNININKNNEILGNKINMIYKNDLRNSNVKGSDNNLTFSKNSNESEFTFKDKGSTVLNPENKKSIKKDNGNDSSRNNIDINNNTNVNSYSDKDKDKIYNNKLSLINNLGKNNEISKNSGSGSNHLSISIEKINNKEKSDQNITTNNSNNNYNKNILKFNYNIIKNEEKKSNENTPKFINEKIFNNFINKETNEIIKNEKSLNLLGKILNNQNRKLEKDINNTKNNFIDKNDNLKNSYQFRIRKINLPMGLNLASIQHNNKLLQNIINKKSKKTKEISNTNKILLGQTEYKIMKDNKNLYNK